jgi:hypothetical protein
MNTGPNLAVVISTLMLMALPWLAALLLVRRLWRSPEVPSPHDPPGCRAPQSPLSRRTGATGARPTLWRLRS